MYIVLINSERSKIQLQVHKKAKTPARTQGLFQFQMVARGGIEPPTQGFSIQYSPPLDYRFQAVKSPNKNIAHNLCLKIMMFRCGVKTVSTNCGSVCEIAQAKMCNKKFWGRCGIGPTLYKFVTYSQRIAASA